MKKPTLEESQPKTLSEVLPATVMNDDRYVKTYAYQFRDVVVTHSYLGNQHPWPGRQDWVSVWYVLDNGKALGWSQHPSNRNRWSFPAIRYKDTSPEHDQVISIHHIEPPLHVRRKPYRPLRKQPTHQSRKLAKKPRQVEPQKLIKEPRKQPAHQSRKLVKQPWQRQLAKELRQLAKEQRQLAKEQRQQQPSHQSEKLAHDRVANARQERLFATIHQRLGISK